MSDDFHALRIEQARKDLAQVRLMAEKGLTGPAGVSLFEARLRALEKPQPPKFWTADRLKSPAYV